MSDELLLPHSIWDSSLSVCLSLFLCVCSICLCTFLHVCLYLCLCVCLFLIVNVWLCVWACASPYISCLHDYFCAFLSSCVRSICVLLSASVHLSVCLSICTVSYTASFDMLVSSSPSSPCFCVHMMKHGCSDPTFTTPSNSPA